MNHGEQICFCRTSKNPKCDVCEKEQFILAGEIGAKSNLGCCHLLAISSAFTAKQPRGPHRKQKEMGASDKSFHSEKIVKLIIAKLN